MMARDAPRIASKLRSISSALACVNTWIVTLSAQVVLDELADESEIRLGCGGEAYLDLREPSLTKRSNMRALAVWSDWLDQGLVAVA